LGVDEDDYKKHLIDKYLLTQLVVDYNNESVREPIISKEWRENDFREQYQTDGVYFYYNLSLYRVI